MRRLIASFALLGLLAGLSCKTRKPKPEVLVDDTQAQLGSIVAANNPQTAAQLLRGFYDLENGAWRWTMPKFAISFRPPVGAKEKGGLLKADLVLIAIGFAGPKEEGLLSELQVERDKRRNVKANEQDYLTSSPKVFAAGDIRRGQSLVVWAIREGRQAARSIDEFLMGETSLPR